MASRCIGLFRIGALSQQGFKLASARNLHSSPFLKAENLYKVLGLTHDATQREIKEAFYALSKLHHPDISSDDKSHVKFQEISSAYEILGDPHKRSDYDRGLVIPKHTTIRTSTEFPSKIDPETLRKADSGSFEAHYVRSYNRHLNTAWAQRADENISKSAFDYRMDQRSFAAVLYAVLFGSVLGGYFVAKYYEEPIPLIQSNDS